MQVVSQEFKNASSSDVRETKAVAELMLDNEQYNQLGEYGHSNITELSDSFPYMSFLDTEYSYTDEFGLTKFDIGGKIIYDKIAIFEDQSNNGTYSFPLNGEYVLPDKNERYGCWDSNMSGNTENASGGYDLIDGDSIWDVFLGTYASGKYLTLTFGNGEYPVNFTIVIDETNEIYNITNNDKSNVIIKRNFDYGYRIIKIIVKDWNQPNSYPKYMSLKNGVYKIYTDEDIINLNIKNQFDLSSLSVPLNTCELEVSDLDEEFNLLNSNSLYSILSNNPKLVIKMGHYTNIGLELLNMGVFYTNDNEITKNSIKFISEDIRSLYDNYIYYGANYYSSDDKPGEVIEHILDEIGITDYKINPTLYDPIYSTDPTSNLLFIDAQPLTFRQLLQKISIMYYVDVWVNVDGEIEFGYLNNYSIGLFPAKEQLPYSIERSQLQDDIRITELERIKQINYRCLNFLDVNLNEYIDIVPSATYEVENGSPIILNLDQLHVSPQAENVSSTGTASIDSLFIDGLRLFIATSGTGTLTFKVSAPRSTPVKEFDGDFTDIDIYNWGPFPPAPNSTDEKDQNIKINGNGYTLTVYLGKAMETVYLWGYGVTHLYNLFRRNRQYEIEFDWRQDLSLELGDYIAVADKFGNYNRFIITEQNYTYNGALKGITVGVATQSDIGGGYKV